MSNASIIIISLEIFDSKLNDLIEDTKLRINEFDY